MNVINPNNIHNESIISNSIKFTGATKITDYLYEISYDSINYNLANEWFRKYKGKLNLGGCTTIKDGGYIFARNFDWYYSNLAQFVIHTAANTGIHKVLGVGGYINNFTDAKVDSKKKFYEYNILPFTICDGINDSGLFASVHVVPSVGYTPTVGTNPSKPSLCGLMVVRYILDHYSSATLAVKALVNDFNIFMPHNGGVDQELQFFVGDLLHTYVVEIKNNVASYYDIHERPFITNFRTSGMVVKNNKVDVTSIEPYAMGVERYNYILNEYSKRLFSAETVVRQLKYTQAYTKTSDKWYSEFTGITKTFGDLKVTDNASKFNAIMAYAKNLYENRDRTKPETWHTAHCSVYNTDNKSLDLYTQENDTVRIFYL